MDPVEALRRHGGVAARRDLLQLTSRAEFDWSLMMRELVADARGRYALPDADAALRAASAVSGVLSHATAALHWGWKVKTVPELPDVTVRRKRRLTPAQRTGIVPHWRDLTPGEVTSGVTSRDRTARDCMAELPFDEALVVADSALRSGDVTRTRLQEIAATVRGAGARQARRVAKCADGRAANPFESALRAIALDVHLDVTPQLTITTARLTATPDLVDPGRRIVLEADSHTWHSSRRALTRDCARYNALVLDGWLVLRFTWEQVMFEAASVRACLEAAVALVDGQARRRKRARKAA